VFGPGASGWPDGLQVPSGDGPRTAVRVEGGCPRHLAAHLERLLLGAEARGEPAPWIANLGDVLASWTSSQPAAEGVLRLDLHPAEGLLSARLEPLPETPDPYRLLPLPHPLGDLRTGTLAQHKGLTGPWRRPLLLAAQAEGADDALVFWPDGTLAETAIASLALERGDALILAPRAGRVASLAEQLDLPSWAKDRGLRLRWEAVSLADVAGERLWCVNAVRGIWPAMLLGRATQEDSSWALGT
jgi:branched-subunit amino acid aminotransferase/4-amino-4-deoxychorismate lyase